MTELQPDEEEVIKEIKEFEWLSEEIESMGWKPTPPGEKIESLVIFLMGLEDAHEGYGKDKPIGQLVTDISDLTVVHAPLKEYDIIWADIMRAVERRIKEIAVV